MYILFAAARFFPFWALPLAFLLVELGVYFKRRLNPANFVCFGTAGLLILLGLLWFVFRGDLNSDAWVKAFIR